MAVQPLPLSGAPAAELLQGVLSPAQFPASRDDVLASLVRLHAPSRLLWEVSRLSPGRRFATLSELCEEVGAVETTSPGVALWT